MSLQRKINRQHKKLLSTPSYYNHPDPLAQIDQPNPDKGLMNGSCNRTACQTPLADELEHQFMEGPLFTSGPRLYYCQNCARTFDRIDEDNRRNGASSLPNRITREVKEST